jgi:hypothetical protein
MLKLAASLRARGFTDIQIIDLGGGLGIDYKKHVSLFAFVALSDIWHLFYLSHGESLLLNAYFVHFVIRIPLCSLNSGRFKNGQLLTDPRRTPDPTPDGSTV